MSSRLKFGKKIWKEINLLTSVPAVMSIGLYFSPDVITPDLNWHHLYSNSAGGKDRSNDTQIRVTGAQ